MAHKQAAWARLRSRRQCGHFGLSGRSRAQLLRLLLLRDLCCRAQALPAVKKLAWVEEDFDEEREYSSPVCYRDQFPDY